MIKTIFCWRKRLYMLFIGPLKTDDWKMWKVVEPEKGR